MVNNCTNCVFLYNLWHGKPVCKKAKCMDEKEPMKMYPEVRTCQKWQPKIKEHRSTVEWNENKEY